MKCRFFEENSLRKDVNQEIRFFGNDLDCKSCLQALRHSSFFYPAVI